MGNVIPIRRLFIPLVGLDGHQARRLSYLIETGRESRAVEEGLAEWEQPQRIADGD